MGRLLVEDHHRIDAGQRGQHFGAFRLAVDGTVVTFSERARGSVGVDGNDESVAHRPRLFQVPEVTWMEQIEHAVGEHDHATTPPETFRPPDRIGT
jgi:hypothetical protein